MAPRSNALAVCVMVVLTCGAPLSAQPQAGTAPPESRPPRQFHGSYAGVEIGRQHLIGGALVGEVDTLQQASRAVAAGFVGLRGQFAGGFVAGVELAVGWTNGRLALDDTATGVSVRYENRAQTQIGGLVGHTLGARHEWLAFAYGGEVTRHFDVAVATGGDILAQRDEQGLLRYGLGLERRLRSVGVRATLGSSRADFGNRSTNVTIRRRLDVGIGVLWQW